MELFKICSNKIFDVKRLPRDSFKIYPAFEEEYICIYLVT